MKKTARNDVVARSSGPIRHAPDGRLRSLWEKPKLFLSFCEGISRDTFRNRHSPRFLFASIDRSLKRRLFSLLSNMTLANCSLQHVLLSGVHGSVKRGRKKKFSLSRSVSSSSWFFKKREIYIYKERRRICQENSAKFGSFTLNGSGRLGQRVP